MQVSPPSVFVNLYDEIGENIDEQEKWYQHIVWQVNQEHYF